MDVSAGASGKDAGKKSPAVLPRADAVAMCALTLLFVWLTARTLRGTGAVAIDVDGDEVISAVLWAMSPLICGYLFSWIIVLSGATGAGAVLVRSTFLPLLAAAAGKLVTPRAGAAFMFLATVYSASASGRALAERRQRAGTEQTAAAATLSAPRYQSSKEGREERRRRAVVVSSSVIAAVMISTVLLFLFWISLEDGEVPAGEVGLGFLMFLAGPWLVVTGQELLIGSPLQADTFGIAMFLGLVSWTFVAVLAFILFDMIAAVFVIWAGAVGMAGFFGYGLAMEALQEAHGHQNQMERASHGRDKEDAYSALIDAATGRCLDCVRPIPSRCTC